MEEAKFIKIAEDLGWSIYQDEREIELQKYIGSGKDFSFSVKKGFDFYRQVEDYYNGFDPDEEAMLWVDGSGHGKNGAPYRLMDIIDDMEKVEEELLKLRNALLYSIMASSALTVADLKMMCDYQIKQGNGNKRILISNDNEGNGFHELFYAFQEVDKIFDGKYPPSTPCGVDENNIGEYITLG